MTGERRKRPSLWRDADGSIAVELAFVLPILVTMLLGAVDFGMAFRDKLRLESAARAGGQMGLFYGYKASGTDMQNLIIAAARKDYGDPALNVTATFVCSCVDGTVLAGCWESDCPGLTGNNAVPIRNITITATNTHKLMFNWPGVGPTISLQGDAVMRVR